MQTRAIDYRTATSILNTPKNEILSTVEVGVTPDEARRQETFLAVTNKTYPVPIDYDEVGSFDDPGVYGAAPSFDEMAVLNGFYHSTLCI